MPATTLVKNPLQRGIVRTLSLYCICVIELWHIISVTVFCLWLDTRKKAVLWLDHANIREMWILVTLALFYPYLDAGLALFWHRSNGIWISGVWRAKPAPAPQSSTTCWGGTVQNVGLQDPPSPPLSHQAPSVGIPSPCHSFPCKRKAIIHFYQ